MADLTRIRDELKTALNMGGLKHAAEWAVKELAAAQDEQAQQAAMLQRAGKTLVELSEALDMADQRDAWDDEVRAARHLAAGIAAGVNASTIFAIESATYLPKLATAVRLARAYGIGAEQLVASALREVEGCAFCGSLEHDTKDCTWRAGQ